MDWKKQTPQEKAKWLASELEEIRKAKAVLERFEKLTERWLKRLQSAK